MKEMKVFVATKETQGEKETDFCCLPEGELVTFPIIECDHEEIDCHCGCKRSLRGIINVNLATTTFKVTKIPLNFKRLKNQIEQALQTDNLLKARKIKSALESKSEIFIKQLARKFAKKLLTRAAQFPLGAIVEKRGKEFQLRDHYRKTTNLIPV